MTEYSPLDKVIMSIGIPILVASTLFIGYRMYNDGPADPDRYFRVPQTNVEEMRDVRTIDFP